MKILVSIQSVSDVITNSSSELFLIDRGNRVAEDINQLIQEVGSDNLESGEDRCSGMGGELSIYTPETWQDYVEEYEDVRSDPDEFIKEEAEEWGVSEDAFRNCVIIDIDHAREGTIKFIEVNFKIISKD